MFESRKVRLMGRVGESSQETNGISKVIWRIEGRDEELRREEVENVDGEDKGDKEWMPIDLARESPSFFQ